MMKCRLDPFGTTQSFCQLSLSLEMLRLLLHQDYIPQSSKLTKMNSQLRLYPRLYQRTYGVSLPPDIPV